MDKETYKELYSAFRDFTGIGFVSFQYRDKNGEVSKRLINVGASYEKARLDDLQTLDQLHYKRTPNYTLANFHDAIAEVRRELQQPQIIIKDRKLSPVLHLHRSNDSLQFSHITHDLYVFGKVEKTSVLRQAHIRPLTNPVSIAKRDILDKLKTSRFKLFLLKGMQGTVKVNRMAVEV